MFKRFDQIWEPSEKDAASLDIKENPAVKNDLSEVFVLLMNNKNSRINIFTINLQKTTEIV